LAAPGFPPLDCGQYVVVVRRFDADFEEFGKFPSWKHFLDERTDRFHAVFKDDFAAVYEFVR
jgi:hypothetical protein